MTTLTNADLAAIRDRYKQCVHESDYADLAEHIPALLETIAEMRGVIAEMATTPPLGSSVHRELDRRIARARALLEKMWKLHHDSTGTIADTACSS